LFSEIFLNSILGNSTPLITHKKNTEAGTAALEKPPKHRLFKDCY